MDDIKQFARNEKELKNLRKPKGIYSEYIGIKFGIENCAMLIMKSGK